MIDRLKKLDAESLLEEIEERKRNDSRMIEQAARLFMTGGIWKTNPVDQEP